MSNGTTQPAAEDQAVSEAAVPDYLADPNAVLKDLTALWRNGEPPDYSKTRIYFEKTKLSNHGAGTLPALVENLVKNWEIEASFKTRLSDWRTIDHDKYSFAVNGKPPQTAEHMLKVGTYNAIITENEYYSPEHSDFSSSHKTFKRMMPSFAWEVLEVYSGPPTVAFKWRHWGVMKSDYVGFNGKGQKVTAKGHGGLIDIQGVTVAQVDDKVRVQKLETWFDPLEMFRQIASNGLVNKEEVDHEVASTKASMPETAGRYLENGYDVQTGKLEAFPSLRRAAGASHGLKRSRPQEDTGPDETKRATGISRLLNDEQKVDKQEEADALLMNVREPGEPRVQPANVKSNIDSVLANSHPRIATAMESSMLPEPGDAGLALASSDEAKRTHEEMSQINALQCPFMSKE